MVPGQLRPSSPFLRRAVGLALVLIVAGPAAGAVALVPPEILYREGVSESEPLGPWLPLDGARISSLGFILGTRAQAKPAGDSATYYRLTMLSVPDGHPDQGPAFDPASPCQQTSAAPGSEVVLALGRFEGPGAYSLRMEARQPSGGGSRTSCSGGPASTASFTIDPALAMDVLLPSILLPANPLAEIARISNIPAGGAGETQCARDGIVQADGSIAGDRRTALLGLAVLVKQIPRTGRWTCVGRARAAEFEPVDGPHHTRWSPPVSFDVISRFKTSIALPDKRRPRYTVVFGDMPPGSEGGTFTVRITPGKGCPRVRAKTLRARVGPSLRARFTFTLPERNKANIERGRSGIDSYGWNFRLTFSGTAQIRPARTTQPAFLLPKRFDHGGVLNFAGAGRAYCTRTT